MPIKIGMIISNNNTMPVTLPPIQANRANVATVTPVARAPTQLNAPIISRIHSVRPGCGACGRH